jgi:hypothetical protein
LKKLV